MNGTRGTRLAALLAVAVGSFGCGGGTSSTRTPESTAPTVLGVSPARGLTAGGTVVTITGTRFAAGATVTFGGEAAVGVAVQGATALTATTPAGDFGMADVKVVNPDGQSGALATGFAYARLLERERSENTAWWWYHGLSQAQVTAALAANSARLVDLSVESVSNGTPTFVAVMVASGGAYQVPFWDWATGDSEAALNQRLAREQARLISLSPYWSGSAVLFAAVLVDDTGASALPTSWAWGTAAQLDAKVAALGSGRIVDLEPFDQNGTTAYAYLAVDATDVEQAGWWWLRSTTPSALATFLTQHQAQLLTFGGDGTGTFAAALRAPVTAGWWYYYGVTASQVIPLASQNQARPTQIRRTPGSPATAPTFSVVMIRN